MGITSPKLVTSGFYRVHLWVIMGLSTFAALSVYSSQSLLDVTLTSWQVIFGLTIALGVVSYVGAVIWLYELRRPGVVALSLTGLIALVTAVLLTTFPSDQALAAAFNGLDIIGGSLVLGATMAAMLLGHWYLNTPTMQLGPLYKLIGVMAGALVFRSLLAAVGLAIHCATSPPPNGTFWLFIVFRWLAGLLAPLVIARMAWITLKIPNTQSATGILYAGVILVFLGELVAQLLSADTIYPV
jgi:hypothetical protein